MFNREDHIGYRVRVSFAIVKSFVLRAHRQLTKSTHNVRVFLLVVRKPCSCFHRRVYIHLVLTLKPMFALLHLLYS